MLPRFEIVHRARPVRLVATERETGFVAPYAAVEVELTTHDLPGRVTAGFTGRDGVRLEGWYDGGRRLAGIDVTVDGHVTHHRSRRHGRPETPPEAIATTLTGTWLTVLTRNGGEWTSRARVDLSDRVDPRRPEFVEGLATTSDWQPREPAGSSPIGGWRSGTFGQLGLRDVHVVSHSDGRPYEQHGRLFLTMTNAGPGFFDTAHTGVWAFDPSSHEIEHRADLYFLREGLLLGDHATHLVRDEGRWLVASSTWGDFDKTSVAITLTETADDLLTGEHVLQPTELTLPTADLPTPCAGVWDPHLTVIDGHWHIAFVAARSFFSFYPALARAADPGELTGFQLLGAVPDRRGTEGTVIAQIDGEWRVLASDGSDNPKRVRRRFPVFDLAMREVGALDSAYPTNIPWPSIVQRKDGWLMLTFDGTPYAGELGGYGSHGDFLVLRTFPQVSG